MLRLITILVSLFLISSCAGNTSNHLPNNIILARQASMFISVYDIHGNKKGDGSGVLIKNFLNSSLVLTAGHLCSYDNKTEKQVFLVYDIDGNTFKSKIVKILFEETIKKRDLCLLESDSRIKRNPITISNRRLKWGDKVWNLHSALGDYQPRSRVNLDGLTHIGTGWFAGNQTINRKNVFNQLGVYPGSSGSMVLNQRGHLVSMITSIRMGRFSYATEISFGMDLAEIQEFLQSYFIRPFIN